MLIKADFPKRSNALSNVQDKPVNLGSFGQFNIMINKDGVIYDAKNPKNNPHEAIVQLLTRLASLNNGEKTAFDSIRNKNMLLKIADQLNLQYDKFIEEKAEKMTTLLFRQGRASIFSLMEALAVCAGKLQDKETQNTIINQLKGLIKKEPFRRLRDFACESAVTRMSKHELPQVNELRELIYPAHPPKCEKLNVKRYVDDAGTEIDDHAKFLKSLGFNHKKTKDGDHIFTSKNKLESIYVPNPDRESAPSIYEHVGDKSTNLIDSWAHAGYGSRIEKALSKGKETAGDGQIICHYECGSASKIGEIKNRHPGVQLITTTEATTDNLDEVCSKWVARGILAGWKWEKISRYVIKDLNKKFGKRADFKEFDLKNHYIFPHMRIQAKYIDRDNDGIKDSEDHLFNVTYPIVGDLAFGYEPVNQDVPYYALNGENLNKAIDSLKLVVRYNSFLGKRPGVAWEPEKIECDGFFTPEKKEINAFHFNIDKKTGKLHVLLSKDFSHLPKETLSMMLAYEAGCFLGKEAGLSHKEAVILGLAMLDRAIHQEGTNNNYGSCLKFIGPAAEEMFFLKKYDLSGISFEDVDKWLGIKGEDDGTKNNFKRLIENCKPVLKIDENVKSSININKIPVTKKIVIPPEKIGFSSLEEILPELGIKGKVYNYSETKEKNASRAVTVFVEDKFKKGHIILLGFDKEGNLHSAGRLNFNVNQFREKAVYDFLSSFAKDAKLDSEKLYSIYEENVSNGKSLSESLLAALKGARLLCPPGTRYNNWYEFLETINIFDLLSPGKESGVTTDKSKFTTLFPEYSCATEAEKELFDWIEKASKAENINKKKLENIYLSKLAAGDSRSFAIKAMFELLPDSISKAKTSFPTEIFTRLCLYRESDVKNLVEILRKKVKLTNEDILMSIMENNWVRGKSPELKSACREAAKLAIAENKSAVEFVKSVAKAAYKEDPSGQLYLYTLSPLQKLGMITDSEEKILKEYLRKHFNYF